MLSTHFNPLLSEISSCTAECGSRESVATSVSELRSLAEHCNFESTLEDMLRDRIVCSINDHAIQQRLLSEEKLTFEKAMSAAQAMETAARNAKELRITRRCHRKSDPGHGLYRPGRIESAPGSILLRDSILCCENPSLVQVFC